MFSAEFQRGMATQEEMMMNVQQSKMPVELAEPDCVPLVLPGGARCLPRPAGSWSLESQVGESTVRKTRDWGQSLFWETEILRGSD
jgi:hypothetical protein